MYMCVSCGHIETIIGCLTVQQNDDSTSSNIAVPPIVLPSFLPASSCHSLIYERCYSHMCGCERRVLFLPPTFPCQDLLPSFPCAFSVFLCMLMYMLVFIAITTVPLGMLMLDPLPLQLLRRHSPSALMMGGSITHQLGLICVRVWSIARSRPRPWASSATDREHLMQVHLFHLEARFSHARTAAAAVPKLSKMESKPGKNSVLAIGLQRVPNGIAWRL